MDQQTPEEVERQARLRALPADVLRTLGPADVWTDHYTPVPWQQPEPPPEKAAGELLFPDWQSM